MSQLPTTTSTSATIAQKSNGKNRLDERFSTFDEIKHRSDSNVGRWRGGVIEFVRTRVAKRPCPLKNQEQDSVAKTVLNIDMTLLLGKIRIELLYNF